ncbi:hypothetical protein EX30DRAFT_390256 [Ascodesmis nigricans]|uniref:Extracellular membrane protein CFEM domain-containing protein n=1 Tax=Ascodesmis nigricans TaxID=341454 RepID=A0A4S2MQ08_9PEZI|nr:hypothetical protein EX30DRAFT_390256 [Ascodesmis nigricans]
MSRLTSLLLIAVTLTVTTITTATPQRPYLPSSNDTTTTAINPPSPAPDCLSTLRHTCLTHCLALTPQLFIQSFPDSCYLSNRNRLNCAKECEFTKIDVVDCEDRNLRRGEVMVGGYFRGETPVWELGLGDGRVGNVRNVGAGGREGDGGAGEVRIEVGEGEGEEERRRKNEWRENEEGSKSGKEGERY